MIRLFFPSSLPGILALATMVALAGSSAAAAPSNDNFANRGLFIGGSELGTNVDATLEPGEPDGPFGTRSKTIWWKWTPLFSGWIEVNTAGSSFDTILAVGTGTDISNFSEIVFNDDDSNSGQTTSRVVFQITASTEYAIAVGGANGAEGDVAVSISSATAPGLLLSTLALAPDPVDVGTMSQTVTATFEVNGTEALDSGELIIDNNDFSTLVTFDADDRVSGDALSGTYSVTVNIPQYLSPGDYAVAISLFGDLGETSVYGEDTIGFLPFPPGANSALTVQNAGAIDTTAPVLTSTDFTTQALDVSLGAVSTTLTTVITDNLSGFDSGIAKIIDTSGATFASIPFDAADRIAGDAFSGTYEIDVTVDQSFPDGFYFVELTLTDLVNNSSSYGAFLENPPFPGPDNDVLDIANNASGYPQWIASFSVGPPDDDPDDDPDKDGLCNLQEYAFNLNPTVRDNHPLGPTGSSGTPIVTIDNDGNLAITYSRRKLAPDLIYTTNWSDDGKLWSTGATFISADNVDSEWERVTATENPGISDVFFGRVEVIYSP